MAWLILKLWLKPKLPWVAAVAVVRCLVYKDFLQIWGIWLPYVALVALPRILKLVPGVECQACNRDR